LLQEENDRRDQNREVNKSLINSEQGLLRRPALGGALYATSPSQQSSKDIYNTILRSRLSRVGSNQDRAALLGDALTESVGAGQGEGTATQIAADRYNAKRTKEVDDSIAAATQGYMQSEQNERQKEQAALQARQFEAEQQEKARQYERSQALQERSTEEEQRLRRQQQAQVEGSFEKTHAQEGELRRRELARLEKEQREAGGLRERETERRFALDQDMQHRDMGLRTRAQDLSENEANRRFDLDRQMREDDLAERQREFDVQAKQRATEFERIRAFEEEYAQKKMEQDNQQFLATMNNRQREYDQDLAERRYQYVESMGLQRDQFTHQIKMDAVNQKIALEKMKKDFMLGIMNASTHKISRERADALAERQLNLSLQLNAFDMAARRHQIEQADWVAQNVHIYKMMEIKMDLERLNQAYEALVRGEILKANELRFMAVKEAAADQRQWAEAERMHDASLRQYEMQLISAREKRDALYAQISSTEGIAKADRDTKMAMQKLGFGHEETMEDKRQKFKTTEREASQHFTAGQDTLRRGHEVSLERMRAQEQMNRLQAEITAKKEMGQDTRAHEIRLTEMKDKFENVRFDKRLAQEERLHYSTQDFQRAENSAERAGRAEEAMVQRLWQSGENAKQITANLTSAELDRAMNLTISNNTLNSNELLARMGFEDKARDRSHNKFLTLAKMSNDNEMMRENHKFQAMLESKRNEITVWMKQLDKEIADADGARQVQLEGMRTACEKMKSGLQLQMAYMTDATNNRRLDIDSARDYCNSVNNVRLTDIRAAEVTLKAIKTGQDPTQYKF
jgi:hypothetical protein